MCSGWPAGRRRCRRGPASPRRSRRPRRRRLRRRRPRPVAGGRRAVEGYPGLDPGVKMSARRRRAGPRCGSASMPQPAKPSDHCLAGWGIAGAASRSYVMPPSSRSTRPGRLGHPAQHRRRARPAAPTGADPEDRRRRDRGLRVGVLALVGIDAAAGEREHILLANLIEKAWTQGQASTLPALVGQARTRRCASSACSTSTPSSRPTTASSWPPLNGYWPRRFAAWGAGRRSTSNRRCSMPRTAPAAIVVLAHCPTRSASSSSPGAGEARNVDAPPAGTDRLRVLRVLRRGDGVVPPTAAPPAKQPILTLSRPGPSGWAGAGHAEPGRHRLKGSPTPARG